LWTNTLVLCNRKFEILQPLNCHRRDNPFLTLSAVINWEFSSIFIILYVFYLYWFTDNVQSVWWRFLELLSFCPNSQWWGTARANKLGADWPHHARAALYSAVKGFIMIWRSFLLRWQSQMDKISFKKLL
jgi:hypothetical protein